MNAALRKRHLGLWLAIALVLPILVITALATVNQTPHASSHTSVSENVPAAGQILKSIQREGLLINLRGTTQPTQLELVLIQPIKAPAATVVAQMGNESIVLGDIGARGVYRFPIQATPATLTLYDPIAQNTLQTIGF